VLFNRPANADFTWLGHRRDSDVQCSLLAHLLPDNWAANLQTQPQSPLHDVPRAQDPVPGSQKAACSSKAAKCQHCIYLTSIHKTKVRAKFTVSQLRFLSGSRDTQASSGDVCLTPWSGSELCITLDRHS